MIAGKPQVCPEPKGIEGEMEYNVEGILGSEIWTTH
jgi:hypothetical protein